MILRDFILVVEDNPSDVDLLKRALSKCAVVTSLIIVENGVEALDFIHCRGSFRTRNPNDLPALVLLDIKMPKMGGLEVLRNLRADDRTRRIPVVMLTSSSEDRDIADGYDFGANSYVCKPVDFVQFVDTIRHLTRYWLSLNRQPPRSSQPEQQSADQA